MLDNLPPGVTEDMIPGNRPEDMEWERFWEEICDSGYTIEEARKIWRVGVNRIEVARHALP